MPRRRQGSPLTEIGDPADTWEELRAAIIAGDEEAEERLRDKRRSEIAAEVEALHPRCCKDAKYIWPDVWLGDSELVPVWTAKFRNDTMQVGFCPFCGELLPKFRTKAQPPKHLATDDDGGYCATCGERIRDCYCSPPETAYEVDL